MNCTQLFDINLKSCTINGLLLRFISGLILSPNFQMLISLATNQKETPVMGMVDSFGDPLLNSGINGDPNDCFKIWGLKAAV